MDIPTLLLGLFLGALGATGFLSYAESRVRLKDSEYIKLLQKEIRDLKIWLNSLKSEIELLRKK